MNYDDLYAGISEGLTAQIKILLEGCSFTPEKKAQFIKLFNECYLEGCHTVSPTWMKNSDKIISAENEKFMSEFYNRLETEHNKIKDGQDSQTPEQPSASS